MSTSEVPIPKMHWSERLKLRFPALFEHGKLSKFWHPDDLEAARKYARNKSDNDLKNIIKLYWVPFHDLRRLIIESYERWDINDLEIIWDEDRREELAIQIWEKTGCFPDWSKLKKREEEAERIFVKTGAFPSWSIKWHSEEEAERIWNETGLFPSWSKNMKNARIHKIKPTTSNDDDEPEWDKPIKRPNWMQGPMGPYLR